jgi:hypothetical protein
LGPTTAVIAEENSSEVFLAKDLNPVSSMDFSRICLIIYQPPDGRG